ncbi:hypothetical protein ACGFWD_41235 [Streptomyces sp. NPDC048448]|uniref:hypothetical protein n=1 Tax=Streptomyces sp. NPDC048448 TaxID=3365554 RepID=UPI00371165E8
MQRFDGALPTVRDAAVFPRELHGEPVTVAVVFVQQVCARSRPEVEFTGVEHIEFDR